MVHFYVCLLSKGKKNIIKRYRFWARDIEEKRFWIVCKFDALDWMTKINLFKNLSAFINQIYYQGGLEKGRVKL